MFLKNMLYLNSQMKILLKYIKSEFESGTRTFVDILDAQTGLYEAKKSLVNREFNYIEIIMIC